MRVLETHHTYNFITHTLTVQVWVWVSDTFEVLIEHSHTWTSVYPPPASRVTPWLFDFPPDLVNLDDEVLDGAIDLTGADEDLLLH